MRVWILPLIASVVLSVWPGRAGARGNDHHWLDPAVLETARTGRVLDRYAEELALTDDQRSRIIDGGSETCGLGQNPYEHTHRRSLDRTITSVVRTSPSRAMRSTLPGTDTGVEKGVNGRIRCRDSLA